MDFRSFPPNLFSKSINRKFKVELPGMSFLWNQHVTQIFQMDLLSLAFNEGFGQPTSNFDFSTTTGAKETRCILGRVSHFTTGDTNSTLWPVHPLTIPK